MLLLVEADVREEGEQAGSLRGIVVLAAGVDGSLAKGGLNGGHRPPLPCDLPMGGFPYEFGPETGR